MTTENCRHHIRPRGYVLQGKTSPQGQGSKEGRTQIRGPKGMFHQLCLQCYPWLLDKEYLIISGKKKNWLLLTLTQSLVMTPTFQVPVMSMAVLAMGHIKGHPSCDCFVLDQLHSGNHPTSHLVISISQTIASFPSSSSQSEWPCSSLNCQFRGLIFRPITSIAWIWNVLHSLQLLGFKSSHCLNPFRDSSFNWQHYYEVTEKDLEHSWKKQVSGIMVWKLQIMAHLYIPFSIFLDMRYASFLWHILKLP